MATTDPVHTMRVKLVATVEGVLTVKASLLDSGADLSVASGSLVSTLLAAGAAPEITTMRPFCLRPYGADSRPVVVTMQVRFGSLEFKTGCGPLMLRGLRVWVDEAVAGVELTLGLPVMLKLGYSDKTLLENGRRQQAEWDFADQSIATPGEVIHRTLRMEETMVDDIDDDEGMCCTTPGWGMDPHPTDGQVDDDRVRTVLMSKVADIASEGMDEESVRSLQDVLVELRDVQPNLRHRSHGVLYGVRWGLERWHYDVWVIHITEEPFAEKVRNALAVRFQGCAEMSRASGFLESSFEPIGGVHVAAACVWGAEAGELAVEEEFRGVRAKRGDILLREGACVDDPYGLVNAWTEVYGHKGGANIIAGMDDVELDAAGTQFVGEAGDDVVVVQCYGNVIASVVVSL
ncbi:hypothetical protein B5M09_011144 [Aphanomyces astaci]|uniref:Peptidase A2 domain-containing protein n=1 Tax=Aphanomyces astaci TaxID=112090 RepID=A0A425CRU9_APHAT|nr:hypothetical protein B5M09_011144 [Aphanomyces astaci]